MNPVNQNPEDEENSDYDIFSSVRPKGISVDDNLSDELDGESVHSDLESFRPKESEIKERKRQRNNPTASEVLKDVTKQGVKETLIGVGGTYGDLAELAGLPKGQTPGAKARNKSEYETLERMEQPGYKPSFSDIYSLSSDDDIAPLYSGFSSSQDLREVNDLLGGPGEADTVYGKAASRSGKIFGSGLAFGQFNPFSSIAAGVAGQAVEEAGGSELEQAGAEIATLLLSPGQTGKKLLTSTKKQVQDKIDKLRQLGYADEEITLAINSGSKGKRGGIKASKGEKTEKAFETAAEKSDQFIKDILNKEISGFEKGSQYVHQVASDFYGQVAKQGSNLIIKDSTPFIKSATNVVRDLRKNLGKNPETEPFLIRLKEAVIESTKNPTAESMMNFYKELNGMGKWLGRDAKDRLISQVKDGIKDTFRSEGRSGRQLADNFEKANQGIQRAYKAQEIAEILEKSSLQKGRDFNKLYKEFDDKDTVKLFEDVIGRTQTKNLQTIAKTGKEIGDFDKAWKSINLLTGGKAGNVGSGLYYLFHGGIEGAIGAGVIKGTEIGLRKLAEKSLTDPTFQNIIIRGLHAIKNNTPKTFGTVIDEMNKYLKEQDIEVDINPTKQR